MLDASCEGFGKGDGICDPGRRLTAPVRLITWLEPIDTGGSLAGSGSAGSSR
jgi:hypothetical protein